MSYDDIVKLGVKIGLESDWDDKTHGITELLQHYKGNVTTTFSESPDFRKNFKM